MLDIKAVRHDPEAVAAALSKRGFNFDVDAFRALDARRRQADIDRESSKACQQAERNDEATLLVGRGGVHDQRRLTSRP